MSTLRELDAITSSLPTAARQNGIQKLPTELLYHIIRLAASTDYKTAHACAYVSKTVCSWTAPDRWKTVICTNARQFESLHSFIQLGQHCCSHDRADHDPYTAKFLSLPSTRPGDFVENLFVDTKPAQCDLQSQAASQQYKHDTQLYQAKAERALSCFNSVLLTLRHVKYLAIGPDELSYLNACRPKFDMKKLMCTSDDERQLKLFLDCLPQVAEDKGLSWDVDEFGYWSPTWTWYCRKIEALHVISIDPRSELTGAPMPISELETMRCGSLAERGLIRYMADGGFYPPGFQEDNGDPRAFADMARDDRKRREESCRHKKDVYTNISKARSRFRPDDFRSHSPYLNPYGRICRDLDEPARSQGFTRIRYDTRKFSFRPCEITASRLKHFFEELTTTASDLAHGQVLGDSDNARPRTANFSHNGPRHAAPPRGAGNFTVPSSTGVGESSVSTSKRAALNSLGCGKFSKLHLCWDPIPSGSATPGELAAQRKGVAQADASTATAMTAGANWPVERQDIWTNSSSQNNEAQAPPPHHCDTQRHSAAASKVTWAAQTDPGSREAVSIEDPSFSWVIPTALEPKQSKAFRADMVDAFRTTIGWTRHDQQPLNDTPGLSADEIDRNRLRRRVGQEAVQEVEDMIASTALQFNESPPDVPWISHPDPRPTYTPSTSNEQLTLGLVPPAERIRLGGMYVPYTKEQRVKWFLDNLETDDA